MSDLVHRLTDIRLATTDPSVAKQSSDAQAELNWWAGEMGKSVAKDYVNLFKKASSGNARAAGGLTFEAVTFFVGLPELNGFETAFNSLKYVEKKWI